MIQEQSTQALFENNQTPTLLDAPFKLTNVSLEGVPTPVLVTPTLWRSLIWPYPTSSPRDRIELLPLDKHIAQRGHYVPAKDPYALLNFASFPKWLKPEVNIKLQSIFSGNRVAHFLLSLPDESPHHILEANHNLLPLGLIGSLFRYINGLQRIGSTADVTALHSMIQIALALLDSHPLCDYLLLDSPTLTSSIPDYLSRSEFRNLLIRDLGRTIDVVSALDGTSQTSELKLHYSILLSPSHELHCIVESLVTLSSKCPSYLSDDNILFRRQLWCHYHTCTLVRQGIANPPQDLLNHVQGEIALLARHIPLNAICQLDELQQRLSKLQHSTSHKPFQAGRNVCYEPTWH